MLALECERTVGGGYFHDVILLAPAFRAEVLRRERLIYDTAFTARIPSSPALVHLFITMQGSLRVGTRVHREPVAYLMTDAEFNASGPSELGFRAGGAPNITLELTLPAEEITRPSGLAHGPIELSTETWRVAHEVASALSSSASIEVPFLALVGRLFHDGLTTSDLSSRAETPMTDSLERVWPVLRQRYAEFAVSTTLLEVAEAAGVSLSQAARDVMAIVQTFPYVGAGFRDVMLLVRLRLAAQFLSGPTATAREVAAAIGYGSVSALRRAFRDAGMPSPSAIAEACRFTDTQDGTAASPDSQTRTRSERSTR